MAAFMYLLHNTSLRPPRWVLTRGRVMKGTANFVGRRGLRDGDKSRGELWVKGWVREGGQRQKWKKKKRWAGQIWSKKSVLPPFFSSPPWLPSSSSISRHPDRAGNWTWTLLSLSFSFSSFSLPLSPSPPRLGSSVGALGPGNSWWQDRGCLSFGSRLPHPFLTAEECNI